MTRPIPPVYLALQDVLPKGPCGICGHPGWPAFHRLVEAIYDRFLAGEWLDKLAVDYGLTVPQTTDAVRLAAGEARVARGKRWEWWK